MKQEVISSSPDVLDGAPCFAGTHVPIQTLFDYLEAGEDLSEFLEDFPRVTRPAALAVLKQLEGHVDSNELLLESLTWRFRHILRKPHKWHEEDELEEDAPKEF